MDDRTGTFLHFDMFYKPSAPTKQDPFTFFPQPLYPTDGLNVLRVLLCQLLGLLDHFLDWADHVEGLLGQGIVLACEDKHRWH